MAKANQKVTAKQQIETGFDALEEGFREFKKVAEKTKMDLLAKSIEMDIAILEMYRKGWNAMADKINE